MKPLQPLELDDIQIFCRAAECISFTEASISLGMTPSAVSKAIRRLETKLKLKLFHRSTRSMRLTEEGHCYYDICRQALENIQDIESQLLNSSTPRGILRISLPDTFAIPQFIPILNSFIEKYTDQLKVEVYISTMFVDFMRENIDLAIRIGNIEDLDLVAKHFSQTVQKVVASPKYLQKYGVPKSIEELERHKCIGLNFPGMNNPLPWTFKNNQVLHPDFAMFYDDPFGAFQTVKQGFGIVQLLGFSVDEALNNGELVELFPDERPVPMDIHIVYPGSKYMPAKVRAFIDYLFEHRSLLH